MIFSLPYVYSVLAFHNIRALLSGSFANFHVLIFSQGPNFYFTVFAINLCGLPSAFIQNGLKIQISFFKIYS